MLQVSNISSLNPQEIAITVTDRDNSFRSMKLYVLATNRGWKLYAPTPISGNLVHVGEKEFQYLNEGLEELQKMLRENGELLLESLEAFKLSQQTLSYIKLALKNQRILDKKAAIATLLQAFWNKIITLASYGYFIFSTPRNLFEEVYSGADCLCKNYLCGRL